VSVAQRVVVIPRIVSTPLPGAGGSLRLAPRAVAEGVLAACLPGPGLDRLRGGPVSVITTGQQPGLFTGPLYTIYKALTTIAIARRLERSNGGRPVVPVFWVAGDDHDFAEANHAYALDTQGEPARIVLRERPAEAPLLPLAREPLGPGLEPALAAVAALAPSSEFTPGVVEWLKRAYQPDRTVADGFAEAVNDLLAPHGLVVFRPYAASAKAAAAPYVTKALEQAAAIDAALLAHARKAGGEPPVPVGKGETLVFLDGPEGRDRLVVEGDGFITRRGNRRQSAAELAAIAKSEPERLSPNVLLRPVVEAALWPTAAYVAGPGEMDYLPQAEPVYAALGLARQTPVARWSGTLVEGRVEKVLERHELSIGDFAGPEGALEGRIVRDALPPEIQATLDSLRAAIETAYARLVEQVKAQDPTLERPTLAARNASLGATHDVEKKLIAQSKRANETLVQQIRRARLSLFPLQLPQERVLSYPSFAVRYGPALLEGLLTEVQQWVDTLDLEAVSGRG
jgi:bacillithiol synthase